MNDNWVLKIFNKQMQFKDKLVCMMIIIGSVASLAGVVSAVIVQLDIYGLMAASSCLVFLLLLLGYLCWTKNFRTTEIATCLGFCFIFFPINFIFSGGVNGGMPMYFVSGVVIIRIMMPPSSRTPLQILYFLVCSGLFIFAHNYPQYITPYVSAEMQLCDMIMSLGISTTMIGWCVNALLAGYEEEHQQLNMLNRQLTEMAIRDGLTNLYNRRYFMQQLERYRKSAETDKRKLSLIMFDIDYFKHINDTYGHMVGDEVLRNFSFLLDRFVDDKTIVGRYGGEEFMMLLFDCDNAEAYKMAENIRLQVEKSILSYSVKEHVTISGGVSSLHDDSWDISKLLAVADDNLYSAKKNGRNQIISS